MAPSVIPPRPVSTARPKPPDAGRVSRNFGPASRQTSEIPVTSSGWLITSACDEWEGILGNALRLYSDAKLLFENGRFASCASLSVLAIEELAEFMGMIGAQPLPVRSWRSHPDKHVGSASLLLRKRYQAALREVLEETGAADPDADYRRLADVEYRDDEMALFESVLARILSDGSLGRFSRAHVKETDRVKQLGFYVDLDDQIRFLSTPSQVTSELAKDHLNFARDVLETLRSISLIWTASQR